MTMFRTAAFVAFAGMAFVLGACGANPTSFAQCKFDQDQDGNALKTSKDCEGGNSCQPFDGGEEGLRGNLCNDAANPCASTSAAFLACQAMGKTCQVITLADGSKGAKCVMEDPICAMNGGCPSDTICTPDGKGGKLCNTMTPAGTCSKHTDCSATQFCNFGNAKCETDHNVGESCNIGPTNMSLGTATPEECATNRCNADLRCGCNTNADCGSGFVCSAMFQCVVDPTIINNDCLEVLFTMPGGGTPVVFHSDAAGGASYTAGAYVAPTGDPNNPAVGRVTLKCVINGSISVPLTSATKGEGPLKADRSNEYQLDATKKLQGIQFQACNSNNLGDSKCYPGIESGRSLSNEVTKLTFRGLGINKLPLTTFDLKSLSTIWVQLNGTTSLSGNASAQKDSYYKP